MFSTWPIRKKLLLGIGLLLVIVATLSTSGLYAVSAYRSAVKSFRGRADELPLAKALSKHVSEMRVYLAELSSEGFALAEDERPSIDEQVADQLELIRLTLESYYEHLTKNDDEDLRISDSSEEREIVRQMEASLAAISLRLEDTYWLDDPGRLAGLRGSLDRLQDLCHVLPSFLHKRIHDFAGEVRSQYHALIWITGLGTLSAAALLGLFIRLFYAWVFRPLGVLVEGSRRVAGGEFGYRIALVGEDEIAELAEAMNAMTARFEAIRDDLDRQVRERTKEVVRSEQMASVGFLAAGVAHEINNPLASIALCAESLESRIAEALEDTPAEISADREVISNYLRMIQSEAFRCKGITERLLDFSRIGEIKRQNADLRELVQGVVDMVGHIGRYQDKRIVVATGPPVIAPVSTQEIKQVVLNLITNALDSLSPGGLLTIEVGSRGQLAEMIFTDNGCGMTEDVLKHLFEPFFTRRRDGQGTGLGLSISYRIVADHGGRIEAHSDGPDMGSRFRVVLPMVERSRAGQAGAKTEKQKETIHRYQAA